LRKNLTLEIDLESLKLNLKLKTFEYISKDFWQEVQFLPYWKVDDIRQLYYRKESQLHLMFTDAVQHMKMKLYTEMGLT